MFIIDTRVRILFFTIVCLIVKYIGFICVTLIIAFLMLLSWLSVLCSHALVTVTINDLKVFSYHDNNEFLFV